MVVLFLVLVFTWRPPLTIVQFWDDPLLNLQMVVGPGLVLGIGLAAVLARMTRSSMLEALHDEYVRTARAKGLTERMIMSRHVLPQRAAAGGDHLRRRAGRAHRRLGGDRNRVRRARARRLPGPGPEYARLDGHPEPGAALRR